MVYLTKIFTMQKIMRIALVTTTCIVVGYLSGMSTRDSITTWYPTLIKPIFNPPNWIFAPIWTLLYTMMGIAGGLIWNQLESNKELATKAFKFFIAQLALNVLWSYLFFELHNILLALIEIILLWLMIYETYNQFKKINKTSGLLLIPYLIWVGFATLLNASIWWLN